MEKNSGYVELMLTLLRALSLKLYNRYSKDLWLIPIICPDFLKRCRVEIMRNGVRVEYELFSDDLLSKLAQLTTPEDIIEQKCIDTDFFYEGFRFAYTRTLSDIDPSLGITTADFPRLPEPLWEVLYSLASLIFNLAIGREKPNLIAPEVQIVSSHEYKEMATCSKIAVEIREVSREEAKEKVKQWCDKFLPHEKKEDIARELVQKGYITKDYQPLIRLNLLLDIIRSKAVKAYPKEKPAQFLKCPYCGSVFSTQRKRAIFCSPECNASFYTYLRRHKLAEELNRLKKSMIERGFSPEEASCKAIHMMVEEYPQLSKAKREELGIGRKRKQKRGNTESQSED